ncbi:MAG: beta-lactamase [Candidatus Magnetoglobus multicellularis str. Araruama]|uniref:Beta-lactamase n=1 Tax=Candidatus Magnetoglobus multicellularis str. Araruama TaxID=890399 RepID=A0A1V1P5I2_9BACT|nr:MAG: beta-lactamase [Candidatus Magnetoglobus multicellularis str. Araruama]
MEDTMNILSPVFSICQFGYETVGKVISPATSFFQNTSDSLNRTLHPITSLVDKRILPPRDLSTVTAYDPDNEVAPEAAGLTLEAKKAIWSGVEDLYRTGIFPGISFCLRRHGKIVLNRGIGHARGNGPGDPSGSAITPMTPETPVCQFSASKVITAMLIHLLVERKEIDLLDPVAHYIPEFGCHGKDKTSIYHIISHHGGIPRPPEGADPSLLFDLEEFVQILCKSKPESQGGRRMAYHAITGGAILAEIIRRVTGMNIREFLDETIKKPLGFRYFNYGLDDEDMDKVAINYSTGLPLIFPFSGIVKRALSASWNEVVNISNQKEFMKAIIPAGNLYATADEMSRFFQMMLNGGELDGVRIFQPLTIQKSVMESDHMKFDGTMVLPMRYSAGLMLGASPVGMWGPFTAAAYGHVGFINIFCWADPERDISVSLLTTGKSLIGEHIVYIARLLSSISWHCRTVGLPGEVTEVYSSYVLPIQKILQQYLLRW